MKKYLNRDMFLILIGNMLADISFIVKKILAIGLLFLLEDKDILGYIFLFLFIFMLLIRLIILPVLYSYLEKNSQYDIVKKFIFGIKTSWFLKLFTLLIAFVLSTIIINIDFLDISFNLFYLKKCLIASLLFGLVGSYLILFLYWFIVDIIKHIKEQR